MGMTNDRGDRAAPISGSLAQRSGPYGAGAELGRICSAPIRLEILGLLSTRVACVGEIAGVLDLDVAHVSHNLSKLRDGHLVQVRREGKHRIYMLGDSAHVRRETSDLVLRGEGEAAAEFILQLHGRSG